MTLLIDNSPQTMAPVQAQPQPTRQKIAICVPSMDRVHADFKTALTGIVGMTVTTIPVELQLINHMNSVIHDARNRLVQMSLEWGADWLLWFDSDLSFPADTLLRLLSHNLDIVGATYSQRAHPYSVLGQFAGEPKDDMSGEHLVQALMMPGGLMLVKASVYRAIPGPWYEDYYNKETPHLVDAVRAWKDKPNRKALLDALDRYQSADPMARIGEDIDFCFKATKAGFAIWCDLDLTDQVTHIGQVHVRTQLPGRNAGGGENTFTPPSQSLATLPEAAE